jgi:Holliday junction resolvase RusA-like endonuclease
MRITLDLPVEVVPKARPRFVCMWSKKRKKHVPIGHPDKKTENNQLLLQWQFKDACKTKFDKGIEVEVDMKIWLKGKGGDIDNYVKQVFDSANKILWHDDRQVKKMSCRIFENQSKARLAMIVSEIGNGQLRFGGEK